MLQGPIFYLSCLAALSGLAFTLIPVAYRLGQERGIPTMPIGLILAVCGAFVFAPRALALPLAEVPRSVWTLGLISGFLQYATIRFMRVALNMGPISSAWCAISLSFLPVMFHGLLFLHESISFAQYLGLVFGIVCVISSAIAKQKTGIAISYNNSLGRYVRYGLVLLLILLLTGISNIAMKMLSVTTCADARSHMSAFGPLFFASLYLSIGICLAVDVGLSRRCAAPLGTTLLLGILAGVGSIFGMWLLGISAALPAGGAFVISNTVSLLAASVVSVTVFKEKLTISWIVMLATGIASILLIQ